mgnify:CR=1 FL=1
MKILWVDTETTGLDKKENKITELAAMYEDTDKKQNDTVTFHEYIKYSEYPKDYGKVAEMTGLTPTILASKGKSEKEVYVKFHEFLSDLVDRYDKNDKMILAGYNIDFDDNFLRELFHRFNNQYYGSFFFNCRLNVMSTMAMAMQSGVLGVLVRYRLANLAEALNIDLNAHSAIDDIMVTRECYYKLLSMIQQNKND